MQVTLLNNKINDTGSFKCEHRVLFTQLKGRDCLEYVDVELEDIIKISLSERTMMGFIWLWMGTIDLARFFGTKGE